MSVTLPDSTSGSATFENILSIRILPWLVILAGCKIKGINELEVREFKSSLIWLCSFSVKKLTLKSSSRKIYFGSLDLFSNKLFKSLQLKAVRSLDECQ